MSTKSNRATYWSAVAIVVLATIMLAAAGCRQIEALLLQNRCVLSDRPIHTGLAVRVAVDGGKQGEACCLRSAVTYAEQYGKQVRVLWVTDYPTGRRLNPEWAAYVTGSDVIRCMEPPEQASVGRRETDTIVWDRCAPSSIAFAKLEDAQALQRIHGGRIQTFSEVIGSAHVVAAR
jgi:hypothetical protein